jgi:Fe-S cluster assembly iron-binding protein IscA
MIEVTEMAQKQIADYFKDKKVMPVRIFLNEGG